VIFLPVVCAIAFTVVKNANMIENGYEKTQIFYSGFESVVNVARKITLKKSKIE
jgi:hypothetical protein